LTLDRILERTRLDLAARKAAAPATALPPRPCGEARGAFSAALARPGLSVIAEIKRASPSAGLIREDFDVVALARAYADAGVAAISCLTDEPFFGGKLEYLRQAKLASGVPLLRKDFIVDEYQLDEALAYGADAVLLIVAALEPPELSRLRQAAIDRGLDTLVEAHTVEEARIALDHGCRILGVNNRDLKSFTVDIETTRRVAEAIGDGDHLLVSESGIRQVEDLATVRAWGADAVLVGERFMRMPDVAAAAQEFVRAGEAL